MTTPDLLQICGGFTQGLALVCRALRARGARRLAVEDPCFSYHRELIANAGLEPVPIPVDRHGIDVAALAAHDDVAGVLVAPAHSVPARRGARAAAARRARGVGASERHADRRGRLRRRVPLRPRPDRRAAGPRPDRVVYGGSVSKTLSPIVRVGWLAAPEWLIRDLRREKVYDDLASGTLDQVALATFIESGDLARHLRRVRPVYRRRRDAALRALARHLPAAIPGGVAAGLHLHVRLPDDCDETGLVVAARRLGVQIEGAARHWAEPEAAPPALVLGYGTAGEAAIEQGVATLGAAYAGVRAPAAAGTAPEGGAQARRWVRSSRAPRAPRAG